MQGHENKNRVQEDKNRIIRLECDQGSQGLDRGLRW